MLPHRRHPRPKNSTSHCVCSPPNDCREAIDRMAVLALRGGPHSRAQRLLLVAIEDALRAQRIGGGQ